MFWKEIFPFWRVKIQDQNAFFATDLDLHCLHKVLNSISSYKFLDWSKMKVFADDVFNVVMMIISIFYRVENIVGKGENAGYKHFLLFLQCFPKLSSLGSLKVEITW